MDKLGKTETEIALKMFLVCLNYGKYGILLEKQDLSFNIFLAIMGL